MPCAANTRGEPVVPKCSLISAVIGLAFSFRTTVISLCRAMVGLVSVAWCLHALPSRPRLICAEMGCERWSLPSSAQMMRLSFSFSGVLRFPLRLEFHATKTWQCDDIARADPFLVQRERSQIWMLAVTVRGIERPRIVPIGPMQAIPALHGSSLERVVAVLCQPIEVQGQSRQ